MSFDAHRSDVAAHAAYQACQTAYPNSGQQNYFTACKTGVFDGLNRVSGSDASSIKTVDQFNSICKADATTSNFPQDQQMPYQLGCQLFAKSYMQQ